MSNQYKILTDRQQAEVDAFPLMFAFSQKQFDEGMIRWGLKPTDTHLILRIGAGGFVRKSDRDALHEMFNRHRAELQAAIDADPTGEGFVKDMFLYELDNHEFSYTWDLEPTLDALGLTLDEVVENTKLHRGLIEARKIIRRRSRRE